MSYAVAAEPMTGLSLRPPRRRLITLQVLAAGRPVALIFAEGIQDDARSPGPERFTFDERSLHSDLLEGFLATPVERLFVCLSTERALPAGGVVLEPRPRAVVEADRRAIADLRELRSVEWSLREVPPA